MYLQYVRDNANTPNKEDSNTKLQLNSSSKCEHNLINNMDKINQSVSTYHMSVAGVMVSKLTISGATTKTNYGWLG